MLGVGQSEIKPQVLIVTFAAGQEEGRFASDTMCLLEGSVIKSQSWDPLISPQATPGENPPPAGLAP